MFKFYVPEFETLERRKKQKSHNQPVDVSNTCAALVADRFGVRAHGEFDPRRRREKFSPPIALMSS